MAKRKKRSTPPKPRSAEAASLFHKDAPYRHKVIPNKKKNVVPEE